MVVVAGSSLPHQPADELASEISITQLGASTPDQFVLHSVGGTLCPQCPGGHRWSSSG